MPAKAFVHISVIIFYTLCESGLLTQGVGDILCIPASLIRNIVRLKVEQARFMHFFIRK